MLDALASRYGSGAPARLWAEMSLRQILVHHDYVAREMWRQEDLEWRRVGADPDLKVMETAAARYIRKKEEREALRRGPWS